MTGVHICQPTTQWVRRVDICLACHERHRITGMFQQWYGTVWTCCGCGDSWSDGQLLPRPFVRGWRRQSIAEAKKRWQEATRYPDMKWLDEYTQKANR